MGHSLSWGFNSCPALWMSFDPRSRRDGAGPGRGWRVDRGNQGPAGSSRKKDSFPSRRGPVCSIWRHILRAMGQGGPSSWLAKAVRRDQCWDCGSLIGAGTKIEEKLKAPEGRYITWLQSIDGALKIVDGSVLEAIATLGLPIATTNYDRLLATIMGQPLSTGRRSLRSSDLR